TQRGNNNAYCQDNELSWFDWRLVESNREVLRFTRELIALRQRHAALTRNRFFTGEPLAGRGIPDIAWYGPGLEAPAWHLGYARFLACTIAGLTRDEEDLHLLFNMSENEIQAALPSIENRRWHLAVDTAAAPPGDIVARQEQRPQGVASYTVRPRSVVVLEAR
ncbi:MAG TPA: glycogen debranching enzyme, partial [Deltaproteobacteria bacterium]|nr:glycogen debranching enzyme [Deltaproteobacteria bacterium]